jgi:type II secretory pathway pseudopilin PulG
MTRKTKLVVWVGAILGTFSIAVLSIVIAIAIYTWNGAAERQRQQEKTINTLKQGLTQDLQSLSKMQIKPMTEEDRRNWLSGANSATPTPEK